WFQQITQDPFGTTSSTVKQALRDDALMLALLWPAQINVVSTLPSYGLGAAAVLLMSIVGFGVALAVWSVSVRRFTLLRDLPDAWQEYRFTDTVAENLLILSP